ncbi:MAG: FKBP-type peptidyl-prolyl cis-trans isomerase [Ignavibacteriaceae bacterium]
MPLKSNQVVSIGYTLTDEEGKVIDSATHTNPFSFLSGKNQILPALEEKVGEMIIGSKKIVVLQPEEGYGIYDEMALQIVDRSEFPVDVNLEEGMGFVADTPDGGEMPFTIKKIDGENITLDFNHPLAGKTLTFDVEFINLRDATSEELSHGHSHGEGGHHHH